MMRALSDLHPYQVRAIDFVCEHPRTALFIDMGLGKTIVTLTAAARLFEHGYLGGVLVLAPRRVAESVWKQEAAAWEQTRHLDIVVLRGKYRERGLLGRAHVFVINYEAIPWLVKQINAHFLSKGKYPPFNMVVFDELTRVKNSTGERIGRFAPALRYAQWRVGLTGTPIPNGYHDLHGQFLALDDGARLGVDKQVFHDKWFTEDAYTRKWYLARGADKQIETTISDITLSLRAEDYLDLPPYIYNDIYVDLPPAAQKRYNALESVMFTEMDEGALEVHNASALTMKCRQFANGCVLDKGVTRGVHLAHQVKLEALDSIMDEANGQPVLLAYLFRADMERILERYKGRYRCVYLGPGVSDRAGQFIVKQWNEGQVDLLLGHPASVGHGLNLQAGGHQIAWFGLDFNLEGWEQFNARLRRQGQVEKHVIVHRILARRTIDLVLKRVVDGKVQTQEGLREALKAYQKARK